MQIQDCPPVWRALGDQATREHTIKVMLDITHALRAREAPRGRTDQTALHQQRQAGGEHRLEPDAGHQAQGLGGKADAACVRLGLAHLPAETFINRPISSIALLGITNVEVSRIAARLSRTSSTESCGV